MSKQQLIVLDQDTGEIWEMGHRAPHSELIGKVVPTWRGTSTYEQIDGDQYQDYPLTPLHKTHPLRLKLKLGKAILNLVPEELHERITGEFRRTANGESYFCVDHGGINNCGRGSCFHRIVLSPPQPPERAISIPGLCKDFVLSEETFQDLIKQLDMKEGE